MNLEMCVMPTSGGEAIAEVFGTEDWERLMETFLSSWRLGDNARCKCS